MKGLMLFASALCAAAGDPAGWIEREGGTVERDSAGHIIAVDLTATFVSDAQLQRLTQFSRLQRLSLGHTRITDYGFEFLGRLSTLKEADFYYAEHFTDDGLAHLRDWTALERLVLRGTRVTSRAFDHIARFRNLRHLDLGFTQIDDSGLDTLADLQYLEYLSIGGNRIGVAGLSQLKLLPSLRRLDLSGVQRVDSGLWGVVLTQAALAEIGALRRLVWLNLSGATLTDLGADRPGLKESERKRLEGLDQLGQLERLEFLDLSRLPVSPEALERLRRLPKLKVLRHKEPA